MRSQGGPLSILQREEGATFMITHLSQRLGGSGDRRKLLPTRWALPCTAEPTLEVKRKSLGNGYVGTEINLRQEHIPSTEGS